MSRSLARMSTALLLMGIVGCGGTETRLELKSYEWEVMTKVLEIENKVTGHRQMVSMLVQTGASRGTDAAFLVVTAKITQMISEDFIPQYEEAVKVVEAYKPKTDEVRQFHEKLRAYYPPKLEGLRALGESAKETTVVDPGKLNELTSRERFDTEFLQGFVTLANSYGHEFKVQEEPKLPGP